MKKLIVDKTLIVLIYIKTLFWFLTHKAHLYYTIAKAFIQNPWEWRENLIPENKAFDLFIKGRTMALDRGQYIEYVSLLLEDTLKTRKGSFKLSGNNYIKVDKFEYDKEEEKFIFNDKPHLRCSPYFIEGMCGISSNKQAEVRQSLLYYGEIKTQAMKKPVKIATIVPYYAKTSNGEYDYVLINDAMIINYNNLDKLVPGYGGPK